ncbi:MAG: acyl-CoA thioesterase [Clostridia bacterium]|jgi:acyl-CoA hydrolase|nr:acyl-CoA thioesterase [Clostridia bacterium]
MEKTISYSRSILSEVMLINKANPSGNIHGGEIMKLMDSTAGAVAIRHSRSNVVTARVNELEFMIPIHVGDLLVCTAELAFVGRSSMEILVTVEVENLRVEAPKRTALTGYFTMVAIDKDGRPVEIPKLKLETPEEVKRYQEREKEYKELKKRLSKGRNEQGQE